MLTRETYNEKIAGKCSKVMNAINGRPDEREVLRFEGTEKEARTVVADGKDDVDGDVDAGRKTAILHICPLSYLYK